MKIAIVTVVAAAAKLDRARKYLTKHNDEYRQFVEKKAEEEKEEAFRRQGEILAKAMEASFNQSLQQQVVQPLQAGGLFPPAPPGFVMMPAGGGQPASSGGAGSEGLPSEPPSAEKQNKNDLSPLQTKLVEVEFSHKFELASGSLSDFQDTLKEEWKKRDIPKAAEKFLKSHGVTKLPRTKDEKIMLLFMTFK
ncbi:unnamed protein product, partial [Prorocentrum cordatum]